MVPIYEPICYPRGRIGWARGCLERSRTMWQQRTLREILETRALGMRYVAYFAASGTKKPCSKCLYQSYHFAFNAGSSLVSYLPREGAALHISNPCVPVLLSRSVAIPPGVGDTLQHSCLPLRNRSTIVALAYWEKCGALD